MCDRERACFPIPPSSPHPFSSLLSLALAAPPAPSPTSPNASPVAVVLLVLPPSSAPELFPPPCRQCVWHSGIGAFTHEHALPATFCCLCSLRTLPVPCTHCCSCSLRALPVPCTHCCSCSALVVRPQPSQHSAQEDSCAAAWNAARFIRLQHKPRCVTRVHRSQAAPRGPAINPKFTALAPSRPRQVHLPLIAQPAPP